MGITLRSVTKRFPVRESAGYITVLDNIDLEIANGTIVALFGPNGCGKTTILNIISGIEKADSGTVSVNSDETDRPKIGYIFQNFRDMLFPWKSALDNVAFGLRVLGVPQSDARRRAMAFLNKHDLHFPWENYPYQLSIGQQQTTVLARMLIQNPANVLFDEPFTALDHEARFRMQEIAISELGTENTAMVFVSHDVDEALYISDELVLLSKRPACVIRRFPVPFERPRQPNLLVCDDFTMLRQEVVAAFVKEVET